MNGIKSYFGYLLGLVGAAICGVSVFWDAWLVVEPWGLALRGWDLAPGRAALAVAGLATLATVGALVLRRRALIASHLVGLLLVGGIAAWAWFGAPALLGLDPGDPACGPGAGLWLLLLGGALMGVGSLVVLTNTPVLPAGARPLRIAVLWNGTILREETLQEPRDVTVGDDVGATFSLPESAGLPGRLPLLTATRAARYQLHLHPELHGRVASGGRVESLSDRRERGQESVEVSGDDWGLLHAGPLGIFFQSVAPERTPAFAWAGLDGNALASAAVSAVAHLSLILATLFLWTEDGQIQRREIAFRAMSVDAEYAEDAEEELEEPEENADDPSEETAERAPGDEGRFGEPEIDPEVTSQVPRVDATRVRMIDPRRVGLVDMLATNQLGGIGAIRNIMSKNMQGLSDKMAVAMAGADNSLLVGNGTRGMAFRNTGPGGGGDGVYGVIHAIGDRDGLGDGLRHRLRPGRKDRTRVTRVTPRPGSAVGGCSKADIAKKVRRRASSFRSCYERGLTIAPSLRGKLTVRWTIGMNGHVTGARVAGSSLRNSAVESCVLRAIRRVRFAKPDGSMCVVQWPFLFSNGL